MKVHVTVEETEIENDEGLEVPGITVTCDRCGAEVEVYGQDTPSIRRGCIMLREQCSEDNFYEVDE